MDNIFGTDGIRGVFGAELNCGSAYLLGAALCGADGDSPVVVVGRDTRPSGEELMRALAKGVHDNGGYVINIGILPTNAVAYFTRKMGCDFGVMISASHNPPEYNGLKVFDRYGVKLCEKSRGRFPLLWRTERCRTPRARKCAPLTARESCIATT